MGALGCNEKRPPLLSQNVSYFNLLASMVLQNSDPQSILAVGKDTLELLCVGLVLHEREVQRKRDRRGRQSALSPSAVV